MKLGLQDIGSEGRSQRPPETGNKARSTTHDMLLGAAPKAYNVSNSQIQRVLFGVTLEVAPACWTLRPMTWQAMCRESTPRFSLNALHNKQLIKKKRTAMSLANAVRAPVDGQACLLQARART